MQSSKHIGKIVRQHAQAVEDGKTSARKRKASSPSAFTSVPKHKAFIPLITIWGAVFLALITSVLPGQAIAHASSLTGIYLPLLIARTLLALAMGLAGGLLGFIMASALSNRAKLKEGDGVLVSAFKLRDVQPIDPTADLGAESFDAPIAPPPAQEGELAEFSEAEDAAEPSAPKLGELAQRGYDIEAPNEVEEDNHHKKSEWAFTRKHFKDALIGSCEGATCEAAEGFGAPMSEPKPQNSSAPEEFAPLTAETIARSEVEPRSLDLSEFAALPQRNGVWVEEPSLEEPETPAQKPEPTPQPPVAPVPESALQKLRQTPADELSLVEMVERFAAALHDHQAQERVRFAQGHAARENALAEALKALSLFSEAGFDTGARTQAVTSKIDQTEDELRHALARLQEMRGAA